MKSLLIGLCLLLTSSLSASERHLQLKDTASYTTAKQAAKVAGYLILTPAVLYTIAGSPGKMPNISNSPLGWVLGFSVKEKYLQKIVLGMAAFIWLDFYILFPGAAGTALASGTTAGVAGSKKIDVASMKAAIQVLKAQLKMTAATGLIPTEKETLALTNSFVCDDCDSVQEKAQRLLSLFAKTDKLAKQIAEKKDITKKEIKKIIENFNIDGKVRASLGDNAVETNNEIALKLLVLSLVNQKKI